MGSREYSGSCSFFSLSSIAGFTWERCIQEAISCSLRKEWVVNNTTWRAIHIGFCWSCGDPDFQVFKYTQFPRLYGCSLVFVGVGKIRLACLFRFSVTFPRWIPTIRSKIIAVRGPRNGTNQVTLGRTDFTECFLPTPKSSPWLKPLQQL